MRKVAVIAHRKKTLGGGLDELRRRITDRDVGELLWYEVPKSKKAPDQARKALKEGAELIFVWGGDGTVQRCVDALAGTDAVLAIVPAGTANLLARNLDIPEDLEEAVRIGFEGRRKPLDLGRINGEHFAIMAGVGFDAEMAADVDGSLKRRLGRFAYIWTGLRHAGDVTTDTRITVDGVKWFSGEAGCVLLGNVGTITGGIEAFDDAKPDDGWLEVGVATAKSRLEWGRLLGRMATGRSDESPFVRITRAKKVKIRLAEPRTYELDGGARDRADKLKAEILPGAITICVP
ncbi:diacylglycerol/lipid kinase family protein [Nonomuraea sp. NPDC050790]|uniref:diacylglycerol/lipid kinase family protein n=1 Tax=Nonomuraea sp. NPDC050790 TaxID=3364371 RepID=UPI0037B620C7